MIPWFVLYCHKIAIDGELLPDKLPCQKLSKPGLNSLTVLNLLPSLGVNTREIIEHVRVYLQIVNRQGISSA